MESNIYDESKKYLFNFTEEAFSKILNPMINTAKEPIGYMGDTARIAILSNETRSFFDYFFQNFAQVTNPPLDYLFVKGVFKRVIPYLRAVNASVGTVLIVNPNELAYATGNRKADDYRAD